MATAASRIGGSRREIISASDTCAARTLTLMPAMTLPEMPRTGTAMARSPGSSSSSIST